MPLEASEKCEALEPALVMSVGHQAHPTPQPPTLTLTQVLEARTGQLPTEASQVTGHEALTGSPGLQAELCCIPENFSWVLTPSISECDLIWRDDL